MNIIILTGNQFRHKYFANTIGEALPVAAVFSEGKVFNPASESSEHKDLSPSEKELWEWHFGLAKKEEERFFGSNSVFDCERVFEIPKGAINTEEWQRKIEAEQPDIVAVYGTSLLKENIINICPKAMINMHLGLSPYYRGSGTNFWPLHNNEPQYVGVTIHKIDRGIDSGAIIHQGRPNITADDNQHSIGNKTIEVGTELMIKSIREIINGTAHFYPQNEKGTLYLRKDFSVKNIPQLKKLMEDGMIPKYVAQNARTPIPVAIIE